MNRKHRRAHQAAYATLSDDAKAAFEVLRCAAKAHGLKEGETFLVEVKPGYFERVSFTDRGQSLVDLAKSASKAERATKH